MILERRKAEQPIKPEAQTLGPHEKTISGTQTLDQAAALLERAREQIGKEPRLDERLEELIGDVEEKMGVIANKQHNPNEFDSKEGVLEDTTELKEAMEHLQKSLAELFPRPGPQWFHN